MYATNSLVVYYERGWIRIGGIIKDKAATLRLGQCKGILEPTYLLLTKKWDISGESGIFWWEKGTLAEVGQPTGAYWAEKEEQ